MFQKWTILLGDFIFFNRLKSSTILHNHCKISQKFQGLKIFFLIWPPQKSIYLQLTVFFNLTYGWFWPCSCDRRSRPAAVTSRRGLTFTRCARPAQRWPAVCARAASPTAASGTAATRSRLAPIKSYWTDATVFALRASCSHDAARSTGGRFVSVSRLHNLTNDYCTLFVLCFFLNIWLKESNN